MGEGGMLGGGGGMTPADMAAVMGNGNDGWGGNNGAWWVIIFIAMLFGGGNWGWGNNRGGYQPQYATQDFVQNGFNFNDLQDQNRDLMAAVTNGAAQAVAATNQAKYDSIYALKDTQAALTSYLNDIRQMEQSIISKQQECCCETLRAIDGVNFNNAMNTAQITQAIASEGSATRAMMQQDKYEQLQMKYADLNQRLNTQEMMGAINTATANVVRYPNGFVYNAGPSPFCGGGCGCGPCNI